MSSTLVFEAASISITSEIGPSKIPKQALQSLHGSFVGACSQFIVLAKILAALVFPVPRGPENKYACENFSLAIASCKLCVIDFSSTTSENFRGRHTRYNT